MKKKMVEDTLTVLLEKFRHSCIRARVPYYMGIVKSNERNKTTYYTNVLSPAVLEMSLNNDLITPQILIMNGFDTAEPNLVPDYDKPESARSGVRPVYKNNIDYTADIKKYILPIWKKIEDICNEDKLPFILIMAESDMNYETKYIIKEFLPEDIVSNLADNRLEKVKDVLRGMIPVSPIYMPVVIDDFFDLASAPADK